jgi:hypothetical protein
VTSELRLDPLGVAAAAARAELLADDLDILARRAEEGFGTADLSDALAAAQAHLRADAAVLRGMAHGITAADAEAAHRLGGLHR